ncbi:MAG: hypothetical protein ABWZ66_02460 [Pyrinomonadaceae bacterium]
MPETNGNENTVSRPVRRRNERTEAKFFEDVEKIIAEAENAGGEYKPPNAAAAVAALKSKRDNSLVARAALQAGDAAEETARNDRENFYKPMNGEITSLVNYAKSAGKKPNEIAALESIARDVKGIRAEAVDRNDGNQHISVANLAYVSRADNYARFIEQYDALGIVTEEDFYKASTHRDKTAAYQAANNKVIASEADANALQEKYDKMTYTDDDSLLNACVSSKGYIKSKFKTTGQPYKNIAKTRFVLPSRLRKKK